MKTFCTTLFLVLMLSSGWVQGQTSFSGPFFTIEGQLTNVTNVGNAISVDWCPSGFYVYFNPLDTGTFSFRNLRTNVSTIVKTSTALKDTGHFEFRQFGSSKLYSLTISQTPFTVITSVQLSGRSIVKDTLTMCRTWDRKLLWEMYASEVSCRGTFLTQNNYDDTLFVNGVKKGALAEAIVSQGLKNGDKLKVKFTINAVTFGLGCCVKDTGNCFSQELTLRFIENALLPTPVVTKGNSNCPGDTVWLSRQSGLGYYVKWYQENHLSRFKLSDTSSTNFVIANRYTYSETYTDIYLLNKNDSIRSCSIASPPLRVYYPNCGYRTMKGRVMDSHKALPNVLVRLKEREEFAFSDADGYFTIKTRDTSHTILTLEVSSPDYFKTRLTQDDTSFYSAPFVLNTYKIASSDMSVRITSGRCRPGFTIPIFVTVANQGNKTNDGTLSVVLDNALSFSSAKGTPKSMNGQTLIFEVDSIPSFSSYSFAVYATLLSTTPLGTELTTTASLTTTKAEEDLSNNTFILKTPVVGSFDPNDIEVTPKGLGDLGYIADTTQLDYTIRFQNMGTDTAFTVVVRSKLPNGLDFSQFNMLEASHPYQLSLTGDTIVWTFADILLPHKSVNEPASHGLIHYHIRQKAGNGVNTEIKNKAGIYFDYNAPVITNEVLNTVNNGMLTALESEEVQESFSVLYPNPSDGHCMFRTETQGVFRVYDSVGRPVLSQHYDGSFSLDLSGLSKGIYYYQTETGRGNTKGKIVLK